MSSSEYDALESIAGALETIAQAFTGRTPHDQPLDAVSASLNAINDTLERIATALAAEDDSEPYPLARMAEALDRSSAPPSEQQYRRLYDALMAIGSANVAPGCLADAAVDFIEIAKNALNEVHQLEVQRWRP